MMETINKGIPAEVAFQPDGLALPKHIFFRMVFQSGVIWSKRDLGALACTCRAFKLWFKRDIILMHTIGVPIWFIVMAAVSSRADLAKDPHGKGEAVVEAERDRSSYTVTCPGMKWPGMKPRTPVDKPEFVLGKASGHVSIGAPVGVVSEDFEEYMPKYETEEREAGPRRVTSLKMVRIVRKAIIDGAGIRAHGLIIHRLKPESVSGTTADGIPFSRGPGQGYLVVFVVNKEEMLRVEVTPMQLQEACVSFEHRLGNVTYLGAVDTHNFLVKDVFGPDPIPPEFLRSMFVIYVDAP